MNRYQDIKQIRNKNQYAGTLNTLYYKTNYYPEIPESEFDIWLITDFSDRLDQLAFQFYGDVTLWWVIAIANPQVLNLGSLFPGPGKQIRVPNDLNLVLSSYNELNEQ
jgi:hypothetical protein|tara:strand:- start:1230 stop:1553 length:324 start_codon:yes stop_codon:yes gene_type:complete